MSNFNGKSAALTALTAIGLGLWGCGDHSHEHPSTVRIISPARGDTVNGPDVLLRVQATYFSYGAPASLAKITGAVHDGGHIHAFLDHETEVDASADVITMGDTITMVGLASGPHFLAVQGAGLNHAPIAGMRDTLTFFVR